MGKKYLYLCIYRPPRSNVNNFLKILSDILILASDKTFHGIYVFGDLNLDLLHHNDDTAVRELINLMYAFSLFSLTT